MAKTILITGASTGIGRITALYFQRKGWNVAATMRNPSQEKELQRLPNLKLFKLDVTNRESIQTAIEEINSTFGTIDVLVNNAGYGAVGPFEAASHEQILKQYDTNVFGIFNTIRAILPYFREKNSGTIINISSMGGRFTFPLYSLYHGTKWAIEGFSESLQFELRPFNIKVKIVEPGAIKTDFYNRSQDLLQKEGLHAYDNYVKKVLLNMQKAGATAPGPEMVAEKIFEAANDKSFQLRYPIGKGAKPLLFMRWLLPLPWFTKIVSKVTEREN